MVLAGFRCRVSDDFDLGFGIVSIGNFCKENFRFRIGDIGLNGKAHGAEGIALEISEISELSTCTLCAMRYALCAIASSIEYPVSSIQ